MERDCVCRTETKRAQKLALNQVVDRVAAKLNNTRTVCRSCYIHPGVSDEWMEGVLCDRIQEIRASARRPFKNLDADESTVLRWLEKRTSP